MRKNMFMLTILAAFASGITFSAGATTILDGPLRQGDERFLLQNDATVVAGGVEVDTTKDHAEWHEFVVSVPANLVFEAGKTYKISYGYVIKDVKDEKTKFYHLLRTGGDAKKDKGLEFWSDAAGTRGRKEFSASLEDADYRLILGVQFGGAIRIEALRIEMVENAHSNDTAKSAKQPGLKNNAPLASVMLAVPKPGATPPALSGTTRRRGFTVTGLSVKNLEDLKKDWNANIVRLMMITWGNDNTYQFMDETDHPKLAAWLDKAAQLDIAVVLDLHDVPNRNKANPKEGEKYNFWTDETNLRAMIAFWRKMASFCKDRNQEIYYDILNEPLDWGDFPSYPKAWPEWSQQIVDAIREVDPTHPIIVHAGPGSLCWGYKTFPPLKGEGIAYSIHFYQPQGYTHQGITDIRSTDLAQAYLQTNQAWPGVYGDHGGGLWDKERLRIELKPAIDFQKKHNVKFYVGEFGVAKWAPQADQYLKDCIDIFEENGWDWTMHAFRESPIWSLEHDDSYDVNGKLLDNPDDSARTKAVKGYLELNEK
jgi:aryl-phospho-beta-D-glucosidase BglC (GH1 family)